MRIPPELHARASRRAGERGVSLNELCRTAIERETDEVERVEATAGIRHPWVVAAREILEDDLIGVVLFGSRARGEHRPSSDVDLLVVVSEGRNLNRELYRRWDRAGLDDHVNPHFVRLPHVLADAGSLWFEVSLDGIILYEGDLRITTFLQTVRRAIADGRLQRGHAHGHPYWVKVPEVDHA